MLNFIKSLQKVRAIKNLQLWLHRHSSQVKKFILVASGVMLLIFSMVSLVNQSTLIKQIKTLTEQTKTLTEQNNVLSQQNKELNQETKRLGVENQSIAKQNRSFLLCGFQTFAKFTRDGQAIENLDLDTCTVNSQTQITEDTPASGTMPSGQPAPPNQPPIQPAPPAVQETPQTKEVCTVDFGLFGIPIKLDCRQEPV